MKVKFAYITYLIAIIAMALIMNRGTTNIRATPATQGVTPKNPTALKAQSIKHKFISSKTVSTANSWLDSRIVAHALGSIEGHRATNSLEAMAVNYSEENMRLFEADLILTSDDRLVLRHDWLAYLYDLLGQTSSKGKESMPLSYQEFMSLYSFSKYEPMDVETLASVLHQHQDIYVITDTKYTDSETIAKQFRILVEAIKQVDASILDRLVIQIYNRQMYDVVANIYPFKHVIYAVYANTDSQDQVLEFCKEKGIGVVAVPVEKLNARYLARLNASGIKVYVHTVNTDKEKTNYKDMGVWGIYSDYLTGPW